MAWLLTGLKIQDRMMDNGVPRGSAPQRPLLPPPSPAVIDSVFLGCVRRHEFPLAEMILRPLEGAEAQRWRVSSRAHSEMLANALAALDTEVVEWIGLSVFPPAVHR